MSQFIDRVVDWLKQTDDDISSDAQRAEDLISLFHADLRARVGKAHQNTKD